MKIPKMAKIVYGQMPAPWAKAWIQKPQGGGKFLVQIPVGARGMVMAKIDSCINNRLFVSTVLFFNLIEQQSFDGGK